MSATKKDFQKLAHELALVRPEPAGSDAVLGLLYSDSAYEIARKVWSDAVRHVGFACEAMNPAFDEDRFRAACEAKTYSPGMHGR